MQKKTCFLWLTVTVSLVVLAGVLWLLTLLVVPKYSSEFQAEGALIGEYYAETTAHDVLFLGDCEVYESYIPEVLWQEYGITAYDRGSPQQLIWQSYYLLEEMLERESPQVVVYNVYAMKYGTPQKEEYNRLTLDGMQWSASKWNAVQASVTDGESVWSYLFPLLRYHDRITQLTWADISAWFGTDASVSHSGYLMQIGVAAKTTDTQGLPLSDPTLPEISFSYLEKMRELCNSHGVTLILVKAPTNSWNYWWYDEWDAQVRAYAEEHGVTYLNFIPLAEEIGIDWQTDTYDAGIHLNVSGAEKLTSYFGAYLVSHFTFAEKDDATGAVWNQKYQSYLKAKEGVNP